MYDVLIVGAGPAGNIAALELAGRGFSVAVLDYRERVGDKLCTGVIGVECAERFPVPAGADLRAGELRDYLLAGRARIQGGAARHPSAGG